MTSYETGKIFESVAKFYLICSGFRIIGQRIKNRHGEIDILGQKGQDLYIFEVKKRQKKDQAIAAISKKGLERSINAFFEYEAKNQLKYRQIFVKGIVFDHSVFPEIIDINSLD